MYFNENKQKYITAFVQIFIIPVVKCPDAVDFHGTLEWYNTSLEKLRVIFDDDSDDYIGIDEIDGVEILLLT